MKFKKIALGLFSVFFLMIALKVTAVEYGGIGGRPAYPRQDNARTESIFIHTLKPGDSKDEGVRVINNTQDKKTILVYAVDSVVSSGGAFSCAQASDQKKDVGNWVNLDKNELILEAGANEVVPFEISVPPNADVGEHNGCIVIQEKKEASNEGSGVKLSFRTGLRIAVLVPGDIKRELSIAGFSASQGKNKLKMIKAEIANTGNVSIDADISVDVSNVFSAVSESFGGGYPVLRGEKTELNFEFKKTFWGGLYKADLSVEYDRDEDADIGVKSGKPSERLTRGPLWFFVFPKAGGLIVETVILIIIFCLIGLCLVKRSKSKEIRKTWVNYSVKENESLESLSESSGISWKLIAKVNHIKPPYALKAGQNIILPPKK